MRRSLGLGRNAYVAFNADNHDLVRNGAIGAHQTEIQEFAKTGVILQSGAQLDVDVVIFATGWRTDYGFFDDTILGNLNIEDDSYYLYRHMVHPALASHSGGCLLSPSGENAVQIPTARIAQVFEDPETLALAVLGDEVVAGDIIAVPPAAFDTFRAFPAAQITA